MIDTARVCYRPLRIGFLIRPDNLEDLLMAVRLNTALWGGGYNPIFAIDQKTDLSSLAKCWRLDLVHPISETPELQKASKELPWLKPEFHRPSLISEENGKLHLLALDILPLFQDYWERGLKIESMKSRCAKITWQGGDLLSPLFTVMFGEYPTGFGVDYQSDYKKAMRPKEFVLTTVDVPTELADYAGPLALTRDRLEPDLYGSRSSLGVYIGHPQTVSDLLNFWNLRAAGNRVIFWPENEERRLKPYNAVRLERLNEVLAGSRAPFAKLNVWFPARGENDLKLFEKFRDKFSNSIGCRFSGISSAMWDDESYLRQYRFPEQTVPVNSRPLDDGRPHLSVVLLPKPVPEMCFDRFSHQRWVAGLSSFGRDSEYTIKPPMVPELNEWIGREVFAGSAPTRVQPAGIDFIEDVSRDTLTIFAIRKHKLIIQLFKQAGLTLERSQSAKVADRVIEQMGGLMGCRVFRIPGVRKLLREKEAREGVDKGHATRLIFDNGSFLKHKDLHIERREERELSTEATFNYLLKKGIFRTGLSFLCPNCDLSFWLSVENLAEAIKCEYCGHMFPIGPEVNTRGDFRFRLSGLFHRDDNQEGALPVILCLKRFKHLLEGSGDELYSTAMKIKGDGIDCESDFMYMHAGRSGKPEFIIAECKTTLDIDDNDISNLCGVYKKLVGSGFEAHIVFAKLAPFSDAEIGRFRKLHEERIRFILLTDRELDPYSLHDAYADGEQAPYNLEEFERDSTMRYLS